MTFPILKYSKTVCLSLLLAMAACGPSGHYDSDNQYHPYGQNDTHRNDHAMSSASTTSSAPADSVYVPEGHVAYYGQEHGYSGGANGIRIPREFFPPSGMCRVWFADRPASAQPPAESCEGIQNRAPADAYIVYGK